MIRLRALPTVALAVTLVATSLPAAGTSLSQGETPLPDRPIRWLAIGDSFSSGEGIIFSDEPCHRHQGAYPPRAARQLLADGFPIDAESFRFVACTGNITDDFLQPVSDNRSIGQLGEAQSSSEGLAVTGMPNNQPFDLVTLTFGGNNIGFADILIDCARGHWWGGVFLDRRWFGCSVPPEELFDRIEALRGIRDPLYEGNVRLPDLYDQVADQVAEVVVPGGHVVVLGYPHPIEDPSNWYHSEGLRCNRIKRQDVRVLRAAGDLLNMTIHAAVVEADRRHPEISFTFLDVRDLFEGHGLCNGTLGGEWIVRWAQAIQHPFRLERSFHPNELGHAAMAELLAETIRELSWHAPPQIGQALEDLVWSRVPHDADLFGLHTEARAVTVGGPGLVAVGTDRSPPGTASVAAVWTSPDGVTWSRAPHSQAFLGGDMYATTPGGPGLVAVGWDWSGPTHVAAVWTSQDGVIWLRVPHDESTFGVSGRDQSEMRAVTAGGPGLVAVGSLVPVDEPGEWAATVWTSPDGMNWSRTPHDESVFGRAGINGVTAGGPGLVAVGTANNSAAVWTSLDGVSWSRTPHDESVFGRAGMNGVTAGGPGLVAVGSAEDANPTEGGHGPAVWTSTDGLSWVRVPHDESVFGGSAIIYAVAAGSGGLVAVGGDWSQVLDPERGLVAPVAAVWTSPDGVTWSRMPHDDALFGDLAGERSSRLMQGVTEAGDGFVAVGVESRAALAAVWVTQPRASE